MYATTHAAMCCRVPLHNLIVHHLLWAWCRGQDPQSLLTHGEPRGRNTSVINLQAHVIRINLRVVLHSSQVVGHVCSISYHHDRVVFFHHSCTDQRMRPRTTTLRQAHGHKGVINGGHLRRNRLATHAIDDVDNLAGNTVFVWKRHSMEVGRIAAVNL